MESTELRTHTLCLNSSEDIARLIGDILYNPTSPYLDGIQTKDLLTENKITILNVCLNIQADGERLSYCDDSSYLPIVLLRPEFSTSAATPGDLNRFRPPKKRAGEVNNLQMATVSYGPFSIDKVQRRAWCHGHEWKLTPKEFELLWWFMNNPQRVISRQELVHNIWGVDFEGYEHTVSNHINRLRKKMVTICHGEVMIDTVWGIGYRLESKQ